MDNTMTKKKIEIIVNWANRIAPGAVVKKRIWPILIYRVRIADYPQKVKEKHARRIKKENEKFHLGLKILEMRWLRRIEEIKDYAPLIVKVFCVKQVNRIIKENVVI
jgi:hypothetical protein